MAVIDAVARKLAGALGNAESLAAESFSEALGGGLEHPHYTRPAVFLGHEVPGGPPVGRSRRDRPLAGRADPAPAGGVGRSGAPFDRRGSLAMLPVVLPGPDPGTPSQEHAP